MRSTLSSLTIAAAAGALIGYVVSTIVDVGYATPLVAVVGVVSVLVVTSAATQRTRSPLPAQLRSEHGWFWHELTRELDRSRRHGCEFVLVRIHAPRSYLATVLPAEAIGLLPRPERAGALEPYLRGSDRMWQDMDGHVYILLPETGRNHAEALLSRITKIASDVLPAGGFRMVTFPHDGLTSGALLSSLREGRVVMDSGLNKRVSSPRAAGSVTPDSDRGVA